MKGSEVRILYRSPETPQLLLAIVAIMAGEFVLFIKKELALIVVKRYNQVSKKIYITQYGRMPVTIKSIIVYRR